jgi:hypothetical protein
MKGVLLEIVKLPIHKKITVAPPSPSPAMGGRSSILARIIPSLGCKFDA